MMRDAIIGVLMWAAVPYVALAVVVVLVWPVGAWGCRRETISYESRYLPVSFQCQVKEGGVWRNW